MLKPIVRKKESYVKHCPGHKNSEGEAAPWCIISHDSGKILSSHKTESEAKDHLKDMKIHGGSIMNFRKAKCIDDLLKQSQDEDQTIYYKWSSGVAFSPEETYDYEDGIFYRSLEGAVNAGINYMKEDYEQVKEYIKPIEQIKQEMESEGFSQVLSKEKTHPEGYKPFAEELGGEMPDITILITRAKIVIRD